jgi:hypothetical protein
MAKAIKVLRLVGTPVEDLTEAQLLMAVRRRSGLIDFLFVLGTWAVALSITSFAAAGAVAVVLALVTQLARVSRRLDAAAKLLESMRARA